MPISIAELGLLDHTDLATWIKPQQVDQARGDMMVEAAVAAVEEAVAPRTMLPATAKAIVLEVARRGYQPRVQQESLGSRSVSYFQSGDPREGIFLTEDELGRLGVLSTFRVGVARTVAPNGAGGRDPVLVRSWDAEQ